MSTARGNTWLKWHPSPKWHPIHYIVHYFWSKVVHYKVNRVPSGTLPYSGHADTSTVRGLLCTSIEYIGLFINPYHNFCWNHSIWITKWIVLNLKHILIRNELTFLKGLFKTRTVLYGAGHSDVGDQTPTWCMTGTTGYCRGEYSCQNSHLKSCFCV